MLDLIDFAEPLVFIAPVLIIGFVIGISRA
jgi:hypothetical protein